MYTSKLGIEFILFAGLLSVGLSHENESRERNRANKIFLVKNFILKSYLYFQNKS
jgi:hypothetical protein